MKSIKAIALTASLAIASAGLVAVPTTSHAATICTHTGSNVMLRSGPGKNYRVIKRLRSGSYVAYLNSVRGNDGFSWDVVQHGGTVGYVRGDYVCG